MFSLGLGSWGLEFKKELAVGVCRVWGVREVGATVGA